MIVPPLIPITPGVERKHDTYDAFQLARLFRAGELTAVHIPTEAEERVRDLVRCRSTFQRTMLKSRHDVLTFLARRELVSREGDALAAAARGVAPTARTAPCPARGRSPHRVRRVPRAPRIHTLSALRTRSPDRGPRAHPRASDERRVTTSSARHTYAWASH